MFGFFKRYRVPFKIVAVLVFAFGSYMYWMMYFNETFGNYKERRMNLFGGIVLGLMAVFQIVDLIEILKERKKKIVQ